MKEFINKNIKAIIIIIIIILLALLGITLAYTTNDIDVTIASGNYNVVYEGTATLPSSKLQPIYDSELLSTDNASKIMKVDFTVKGAETNPADIPIIYDVSLTNLNLPEELQSQYLKWRLYKNNTQISEGSFSKEFDIQLNNRMVLTEIQQDLPSYTSTADSYSFYIWISEACTGDITTCNPDMDVSALINKEFSGEIRIELSTKSKKTLERPKPAYKKIMTLASAGATGACAEGGTGVCATNSYIAEDGTTKYHDYRYRGAEPNNYVSFNNDLYRIIGVFDDYTHGVEGKYLIKLIMADRLYGGSWGSYSTLSNIALGTFSSYKNDWTGNKVTTDDNDNTSPTSANILLNEFFYNKISTSDIYGSCSNWTYYCISDCKTFSCSDIVGHGLDSTYRNYVQEVTWHLRGYTANSNTKQNFYLCERGWSSDTTCMSGNSGQYDTSTTGNIGLMYVSDYLYASSYKSDIYTSLTGSSSYFGNKNWLYKGPEWTITPDADSANIAFRVSTSGYIDSDLAHYGNGVRPTFYLKSSIGITGGEGTVEKPYILS